jgi:hypothetical protein
VDNAARGTAQKKSRLSAGFPDSLVDVDATVLLLRLLTGLPLTAGILLLLLARLLAAALLLLLAGLLARVLILLTRVHALIRHAGISLCVEDGINRKPAQRLPPNRPHPARSTVTLACFSHTDNGNSTKPARLPLD